MPGEKVPEQAESGPPPGLPHATEDEKNLAMIAWLLSIFTGFIGPLIIWAIKKEESKFIAYQAGMSMWFNLVGLVLGIVTCGLFSVVVLIVDVIWCVKAKDGKWDPVPVVGKWSWPPEYPYPE